jgi:crotonobetainyl-CoA:carnitine CoA-transferase CaiB-like acyl-CoA transferase
MRKALDGINVVEFESHLGAAYAAMLLAEQGACAIKVEPRGGSRIRGTPHFHVLNRSKRVIEIDLDASASETRVGELLRWADVVITGFTPERLAELGLDYESIKRINRRAIVLSMAPLGVSGPDANFDADDDLVAARSGITGSQWARSGDPVALTFPAASYSAGVMGASAAAAAIFARGDGAGQSVEVSVLAGAFSLQTGGILRHQKMTSLYHGPQDPLGPIPCYRLFEAADGKFLFAACGNSTFWGKFAIAIDRPELVGDPRFENAPWGIPAEHWQPLKDIIEPIIRTKPRDEWLGILREADVPCAPVMTRHEFIEHPQVRALGMRREIDDPTLGRTVQMGQPVFLNDTPGEIADPAPARGDDRAAIEWLRESKRDNAPVVPREVNRGRPPLDGVTVLDFASYIAGSYGPMILAQLGAKVIKIESLEGDSFRHFGFGFLGWNQGKRAISLNLASPEGRDIIHGLADRADVVVENLRPGRMRRFGFDYESLAARNPRIIYMSVNAFGNRGPDHNQPGFDPLLQARSGVMAAQGGHHGHPVYLTCAICDYGAAMLSAFGCVLALRARELTGRGQFCETSLLQSAMAFQAGEFIFYPGRPDMEDSTTENRGRSALSRAYKCRDSQWLFISLASEPHWNSLRAMFPGLPNSTWPAAAADSNEGALATALADQFAQLDRAEALAALSKSGVPATQVNHFRDLFDDPQVLANDLIAELTHSDWGKVRQTGMLMKFSKTPGTIERSGPRLGEHTDEIIREHLGYSTEKITALRAAGIIK